MSPFSEGSLIFVEFGGRVGRSRKLALFSCSGGRADSPAA